jgi:hypothetical protein
MKYKVTVYKKVLAWEKNVYEIDADSKDDASAVGVRIANAEPMPATIISTEIMSDTIRYEIDKFDIADISYEVAIDGEMVAGGGKFCDSKLQRAIDKIS